MKHFLKSYIICVILSLSWMWGQVTIGGFTNTELESQRFNYDNNLPIESRDNNSRDLIWTTGEINLPYYNGDIITFNFGYNGGYENIIFEIRTGVWNGNSGEGHYFDLSLNDSFVGQYDGGGAYNSTPTITYINIDEYILIGTNYIELIFAVDYEGRLGYINIYGDPPSPSTIIVNYQSDWNLVGLPSVVENPHYLTIFPDAIENTLFSFSEGYVIDSLMIHGEGYWLRFNESGSTDISGIQINELTISLNEGWNLISGISTPINISDIQDPNEIIISGTVFGFSPDGYSNTEIIEPGKGYWIRCFNDGEIIIPEIEETTVTDIDGNVYQIVQIGDQVWMAENLKVTHYNNGDEIQYVQSESSEPNVWENLSTGAYGYYNDDLSHQETYGNLYNWYAVETGNLAPEGWHVPTDDEIKELEMYLGMSQEEADGTGHRGTNEGSKLAGMADLWNDGNLVNNPEFGTSGFNLLPGGYRISYGGYYDSMGLVGYFWSSTENSSNYAWNRVLYYYSSDIDRNDYDKKFGFSVRCIRD